MEETKETKKTREQLECSKHPLLILFIGCMLVFAAIAAIVAVSIALSGLEAFGEYSLKPFL